MIDIQEKQRLCQSCDYRRNYLCQLHGDDYRHLIKSRNTCKGWGNVETEVENMPSEQVVNTSLETKVEPSPLKVGFIVYGMSSGGIPRHILTLMEAPVTHSLRWSGVAIATQKNFDSDVANKIRRQCPIFSFDQSEHTTVSKNPFQKVVDRSDVIYMTGYTTPHPLFQETNFQNKLMVICAHGQCEGSTRQIEHLMRYSSRHALMSVSRAAVDRFPESLGDQVEVIYNGVDFTRCAPVRTREEVRNEWGVKPGVRTVGYIGRMANDKNVLAAAQAVKELGTEYHGICIGDGYAEEQLRRNFRNLCGDRCTIVDKIEDIGTALNALDCIVIASPAEGGPMIAAEAWVAGCPVVATQVGMIPELEAIHGKLTHSLPESPTATDLAKVVRMACEEKEVPQRARKVAWMTFNPSVMVKKFERLIQERIARDIRVGFCIETCSMGGVSRGIIALMDQGCPTLRWSGVGIHNAAHFDPETAKSILRHCPIYCSKDDPKFQGMVTIVPNPYQTIVDQSYAVKFWGAIHKRPEFDQINWGNTVVITTAHGQCEWTRQNVEVSLQYGNRRILYSVSERGKHCFPEHLRDRVNVVYNGLDMTRCIPQRKRIDLRQEWGVHSDAKLIAHIGRFAKDKNPLAAAQAVASLGWDYHALYVGEGCHSEEMVEQVKSICGNRVTFVPRTEDVGSIFAAIDCLVLASPSEGCPQVMMEAFGARCPVVSTRVGFLEEFEPEYGKLTVEVPFDPNPEQLAEAVREAIVNQEFIDKAFRCAMEKFNVRDHARAFEKMVLNGDIINR